MIDFTKLKSKEDRVWLRAVIDLSIKESYLLQRSSHYFKPPPPKLFKDQQAEDRANKKLQALYLKLGGPPEVFLMKNGAQHKERYDEFTSCAVREMLSLFDRARTAVVKTHSMSVAYLLISGAPSSIQTSLTEAQLAILEPEVKDDFWNQAETAYIRLASLWDRAGQLLDYVFFNIRQFEHDGFPSVLDRIKTNFAQLDPKLDSTQFWKEIKTYAYSEQSTGLKWLLRRRNLLIHSLHLGDPANPAQEAMDIKYYYNHLEEAMRRKLGTMPVKKELSCLHSHLSSFINLLEPLCDLCLWGVDLIQNMRKEKAP